jgi:hypothetical protein
MKKLLGLLLIAGLPLLFGACRTYELGADYRDISVQLQPEDYEILGTVRIEERVGEKNATYDGLLKEARKLYGEHVDVVNIKIDKYEKGSEAFLIMNAFVIRYY